ncbi:hypothetical protein C4R89_12395 [Clostridioides difficile]|nr:hypothetical protein [Clostridioides difficile]MDB0440332.1 hypothetical protein [Clostridioides difficile]
METILEQLTKMEEPLETKYRTMSDIVLEAYCEKYDLNKGDIDLNKDEAYKNYKDSSREKIGVIAKNLGMNIEEFRENSNKYNIPFNVAEVIIQYLVEESKKGSFISKIKSNKLNKITNAEKLEFMNKTFDRVLKSCRDKEDEEYVNILRKEYSNIIGILEKADKKKQNLISISEKSIDENIKNIYAIKDTDGIVKFGTQKDKNGIVKPKYQNVLTVEDSDLLVDAYSLIQQSLNKKWSKIIENYIKKKKEYIFESLPEDAEKLVDVELCMLKDALDVTYLEKDDIKEKISPEELDSIKKFLMKNSSLSDNRVINVLNSIVDDCKNDL